MTAASFRVSRTRSRVIKIFLGLLAICGVAVLVIGGFGIWTIQRAFPDTEGTLQVSGIEHDVTVQRDARGVPTITAEMKRPGFCSVFYTGLRA